MLAAHLHHAGPEQPHAELKHTESHQLQLPMERDACKQRRSMSTDYMGGLKGAIRLGVGVVGLQERQEAEVEKQQLQM